MFFDMLKLRIIKKVNLNIKYLYSVVYGFPRLPELLPIE